MKLNFSLSLGFLFYLGFGFFSFYILLFLIGTPLISTHTIGSYYNISALWVVNILF